MTRILLCLFIFHLFPATNAQVTDNPIRLAKEFLSCLQLNDSEKKIEVVSGEYRLPGKLTIPEGKKSFPTLNHLFIEGKGKSMPAEYSKQGNVSEDVIRDISGWIREFCQ